MTEARIEIAVELFLACCFAYGLLYGKNRMKLIQDPWNGQRYQWRYYDAGINLWFDYGDSYTTYTEAMLNKP